MTELRCKTDTYFRRFDLWWFNYREFNYMFTGFNFFVQKVVGDTDVSTLQE